MNNLEQVTAYLSKHQADGYQEPTRIVAEKGMMVDPNNIKLHTTYGHTIEHRITILYLKNKRAHDVVFFQPFTSLDDTKLVIDKLDEKNKIEYGHWLAYLVKDGCDKGDIKPFLFRLSEATALQRMTALWMALDLPMEET